MSLDIWLWQLEHASHFQIQKWEQYNTNYKSIKSFSILITSLENYETDSFYKDWVLFNSIIYNVWVGYFLLYYILISCSSMEQHIAIMTSRWNHDRFFSQIRIVIIMNISRTKKFIPLSILFLSDAYHILLANFLILLNTLIL